MKLKLLGSIGLVSVAVVSVAVATVAYFSETITKTNNVYAMGDVDIDADSWTTGFPASITNMAPGGEYTSGVLGVGYGGSLPADIYFGLKDSSPFGGANFQGKIDYYVEEVDSAGNHVANVFGWRLIDDAFANWNKIATNIPMSTWKYYKIHVKVHDDLDNTFQNASATNSIFIYAVQTGYSAPGTAPYAYNP